MRNANYGGEKGFEITLMLYESEVFIEEKSKSNIGEFTKNVW